MESCGTLASGLVVYGVAAGMRFVRHARIFDIVTVHDPDDTGRYLVCRVRETGS